MTTHCHPLVVPDLGLSHATVTVSCWLVPLHARVTRGDRVVELLAGPATVDLSAPASGRLRQQLVEEDQAVVPGQILGVIESG
jgi:pyruvate/2-oxoglutarate dehydrogenase complex dihydrolipoamide acyltransferase (E2) component